MSLLGFALTINASILTLAGAVFYYGDSGATADDATLGGAFNLLQSMLGNGEPSLQVLCDIRLTLAAPAIIFALALLCVSHQHLSRSFGPN